LDGLLVFPASLSDLFGLSGKASQVFPTPSPSLPPGRSTKTTVASISATSEAKIRKEVYPETIY
jgi:hypothetical protein